MKKLRIALVIGTLMSTFGATFYLTSENTCVNVTNPNADTNTHVLHINSFYRTITYDPVVGYSDQYKIGTLENEGSYFYFNTNLESYGVETIYGNGHMVSIVSCNKFTNMISVGMDPEASIDPIYFTKEDYNAGKPIPLQRFSFLRSIKLVMGYENEVELRTGEIFGKNYLSYDEETRTYTFEKPDDTLTGYMIAASFSFTGDFVGKKFVLDEIILNYDC